LVLAGGWSSEREVSLRSGETVMQALDGAKYDVSFLDPKEDLPRLMAVEQEGVDLAFILLHGRFGEDGCLQGLLEILGIPYVGSGVLTSALAQNKEASKEIFHHAGLKVPPSVTVRRGEKPDLSGICRRLGPSLVVKPVHEGSSVGLSLCKGAEELDRGLRQAFIYDDTALVERFIQGMEITACVLGNTDLEVLPLIQILPPEDHALFDYQAKYTPGMTREICPAPLPPHLELEAAQAAMRAHLLLGCRVWSRTDMVVCGEEIYILETNTIPGMTETSLFPLAARSAGLTLPRLLDRMVELALHSADPGQLLTAQHAQDPGSSNPRL